jgi:ElaA protein
MNIAVKTYQELTKGELYELLRLRTEVFVVEQDCVYQDIDNKDQKATHIIGKKDNKIVAYTRIFRSGDYFDNPSIGRVVVDKSHRKYGYGRDIMLASIKAIEDFFGRQEIELSAQVYLKRFYNDLNFIEKGEGYLEDGIPHVRMVRPSS